MRRSPARLSKKYARLASSIAQLESGLTSSLLAGGPEDQEPAQ
jgi:hypothetical protein